VTAHGADDNTGNSWPSPALQVALLCGILLSTILVYLGTFNCRFSDSPPRTGFCRAARSSDVVLQLGPPLTAATAGLIVAAVGCIASRFRRGAWPAFYGLVLGGGVSVICATWLVLSQT
jgi:hypothetical protein